MFRVTRHGERWRATDGQITTMRRTRLDTVRSLSIREEENVMAQPRRWVVYATSDDQSLNRFADAVFSAGSQWKPVAIEPFRVDEAVKALHPEAVVVATKKPEDHALLRRAFALHGQRRIVIDDRGFMVLSRFLASSQARFD
jgi:hypothetical protein